MEKNFIRPTCWYGTKEYFCSKDIHLRLKSCVDLIKNYYYQGIEILDIGGYTGELFDLLPKGVKYFIIDFDQTALSIARRKGIYTKELELDNEEINFDDKKFDVIIATEILEHLKDPGRHLKSIKEILKPNGVVLISLPNECTIYHRLMMLFGKGIDICAFKLYKHLHFPTITQSEDLISRYFRIIKKKYYFLPDAKGSRLEKLGVITSKIPGFIWDWLINFSPRLFARGTIFLCKKKTEQIKQ